MPKPDETHFWGNINQKALIIKEGKILLVQYPSSDKKVGGKWDLPGGRLNTGEDAVDGLKREIFEEIGLEITIEKIVATGTFMNLSNIPNFFVIYQASVANEGKSFQFNDGEVEDARWFDPKDFFALTMVYPEYQKVLRSFFGQA